MATVWILVDVASLYISRYWNQSKWEWHKQVKDMNNIKENTIIRRLLLKKIIKHKTTTFKSSHLKFSTIIFYYLVKFKQNAYNKRLCLFWCVKWKWKEKEANFESFEMIGISHIFLLYKML